MKTALMTATAVLVVTAAFADAQTQLSNVVDRLDPALDAIVSPAATLEVLKDDYFGFAEGPVWVREGRSGYLLFSDIAANSIYKWTPDGKLSVFLQNAGFTGTDTTQVGAEMPNGRLRVLLIGSNGLDLDPQGRLIIVAEGDRTIVRVEKDGTRNTLADRYEGKRLNSPNDLVVKSNGSIYFTDQTSGLRNRDRNPTKELDFHGVFLIKGGKLILLDKDPQGSAPNGIALSPDEKILYVNGGRKIARYDVLPDDTIANGRLLLEETGDAPGTSDGMKVDSKGNIYCTGPGGVWIITPEGKHIGTIRLPQPPTNMAFGDADGRTLYITNRASLYRIRLNVAGIPRGPQS